MNYLFPASVEQAIEMLCERDGHARLIAGGTDLMLEIHKAKVNVETFVDITRIPGLDQIEIDDTWITVGARVTFAILRDSDFLRAHVPALVGAACSIGAEPIQAMATWVGNIAQAMPAADGGVVAVALNAEARVVNADGARWIAVEQLYRGAKISTLDPTHEMISHLRFPTPRANWGCAWKRIGRRPSLTLPILNCATTITLENQTIVAASIALGPVATLPFRARRAESILKGRAINDATITRAAEIAQSECQPRSNPLRASGEYRAALIPVLVRDALNESHARASKGV